MKIIAKTLVCLATMLALAGSCGLAYAAVAGHAQFVYGAVQLTSGTGKTHPLQKGDAVNEGDILATAADATAQISMVDGGFIALRPDSRLKFDSFRFNGRQDGSEQSFYSLFRGGFRAITGLIGKINKASYRIGTPSATLGIRGTDHEIVVVVPGSPLALLAPAGTYNKVNLGETSMTTGKGTIFILPNQMGYAGGADQMPQLQPLNLKLFSAVPPPAAGAGSNDQGIRDYAVVDSVLQDQHVLPGMTQPTNTNFILLPITARYTTTSLLVTGAPVITTRTVTLY
jgi:hypothetical protein